MYQDAQIGLICVIRVDLFLINGRSSLEYWCTHATLSLDIKYVLVLQRTYDKGVTWFELK